MKLNQLTGFIIFTLLIISSSSAFAVLGGEVVNKGSAGWEQSIRLEIIRNGKAIGNCSGVIIEDDTIITAGHCILPNTEKLEIYFGFENGSYDKKLSSTNFIPYQVYETSKGMHVPMPSKYRSNPTLDFSDYSYSSFLESFESLEALAVKHKYDFSYKKSMAYDIALC